MITPRRLLSRRLDADDSCGHPAAFGSSLSDEGPDPVCGCSQPVATPISSPTRNGSRSTMTAALGFLAASLSISNVWPQVWRSCRHGRTSGLSSASSWFAVALNLSWLTFALLIGDPAQVLTHVVVGVGNTAVLVSLVRNRPDLRDRGTLVRTAAGPVALVALAAGSAVAVTVLGADRAAVATVLGAVITTVGVAAAVPQPLSLLTDRTQDLSGLSPARWWLGAGSGSMWVTYGWLSGQSITWLTSGFGLCCALVICGVLVVRRPAASGPAPVRVRPVGIRLALAPAALRPAA